MGVASLVLGIIGIFTAVTFIISPLGFIGVVVGLILGIVDVVKKGKTGQNVTMGIVGIVICAIMVVTLLVESAIMLLGVGTFLMASDSLSLSDMSSNVSSQEVETFNSRFKSYQGNITGSSVRALLNSVNSNNIIYDDHIITCKYNGTTMNTTTIKSQISVGQKYSVKFGYDREGYINTVNITGIY